MSTANAPLLTTPPALLAGLPLYLTGEDALRVAARNALTGVTVALRGRFLPLPTDQDPAPPVKTFNYELVPASDRTTSSRLCPLGEGWLLDASVVATVGAPLLGQTFVTLQLARGAVGAVFGLSVLAQGYVTSGQAITWPGSPLFASLDAGGALRAIAGTTPAAGAEVSETVPAGARWELISFEADLTTSAAVANRNPMLVLDDGVNVFYRDSPNIVEGASTTFFNLWAEGMGVNNNINQNVHNGPLPTRNQLGAGFRIRTVTGNLQAGDQYASPKYLVREWIEGA